MIPHNKPTLGKEEEQAAVGVLKSGWLSQGIEVEKFEQEFCKYVGVPEGHAVAVSSGTAALYLALWALDACGKSVAIPTYSCSSLRHAIAMVGASQVLLDTEKGSPNIGCKQIEESKAEIAIVPHMYGIPINLSRASNVLLIEDCAQALGAYIKGESVGLKGCVGIYSFFATKIITSGGQGGMVVSKDQEVVEKIRDYREFDYRQDKLPRFNFQLTDLQAAVGRVQLSRLPKFLSRRKQIFESYKQNFPMLEPDVGSDKKVAVCYRAVMKTKTPQDIINHLNSSGIKSIVPIEDWELLGDASSFPNAYEMTQTTISLPIYPSLSNSDVDYIIETVSSYRSS